MRKNEKGITLLSLVITIVIMSILAGILVSTSYTDNPAFQTTKEVRNSYYEERENTETKINEMTTGWEDIIG